MAVHARLYCDRAFGRIALPRDFAAAFSRFIAQKKPDFSRHSLFGGVRGVAFRQSSRRSGNRRYANAGGLQLFDRGDALRRVFADGEYLDGRISARGVRLRRLVGGTARNGGVSGYRVLGADGGVRRAVFCACFILPHKTR